MSHVTCVCVSCDHHVTCRAAFQFGVKMNDGRKTRRQGVKNDKAKLDREWQQISQVRREGGRKGREGEEGGRGRVRGGGGEGKREEVMDT